MSESFVLARDNRDAWPAIRGFAYQIDSTIIEWISLAENDYLELEWGEDIDIINRSLKAEESEARRLVQVKCTDGTVSLRSPEALQAVCSYVEHLNANPRMALNFRFLTTAVPAAEPPPEPLRCVPGITLWENIRTGAIETDERHAAINSIAAFFQSISSPKSVRSEAWKALLGATSDSVRLDQIIRGFQWSTGAAQPISMEDIVRGLLVTHKMAVDAAAAKAQHELLFVYVMRLLSRPKSDSDRRLSRAQLANSIQSLKIKPHEQLVLDEIKNTRQTIIDGFSDMKQEIGGVKASLVFALAHPRPPVQAVIDEGSVNASFKVASTSLLSWPTETLGKWIERPELESLSTELNSKESSCAVLLGAPGSGKSALLAQLGKKLQAEDHLLLAIKADLLPRDLDSLFALDEFLGLASSLTGSIKEIASQKAVFLLIDQLDALGSLMDLHTQRLDIILRVVNALNGIKNVHILISCREFDFQYDARFKTLKAQRHILADPPWEIVQRLLESQGISTVGWPAEIRETMRTPQHLSFFLENFFHDPKAAVFSNYQAMLDEVFTRRVLRVQSLGPKAVEACEKIASAMSGL
jgi:energy-coupling factor transporter ATP-binding protein EcfA2